jgi:hypothetical protein
MLLSFALVCSVSLYQPSTVHAAVGTNGNIEVSANQCFIDTAITIHLWNLDASSDYGLDFTAGCQTNFTFTTSASETTKDYTLTLSSPSTGSQCAIELSNTTNTAGIIDQVQVRMRSGADLVPSAFFMTIMAPLVILMVVAVIVGGLVYSYRGR